MWTLNNVQSDHNLDQDKAVIDEARNKYIHNMYNLINVAFLFPHKLCWWFWWSMIDPDCCWTSSEADTKLYVLGKKQVDLDRQIQSLYSVDPSQLQ